MSDSNITAFAFPGMGIRLSGFERAVFLRHRQRMLPFLQEATEAATADFVAMLELGTIQKQNLDDRNSQIFTFGFSAALYEVFRDTGIAARYMAGYSFGHYGSLYAARCLSFSGALSCACRAFDLMQECCPVGTWGMVVIVGLGLIEIDDLVKGSITLVNVNSDTCVICAGLSSELLLLRQQAVERGALKAEVLPVAIPYHMPGVLSKASEKLRPYLETLSWRAPAVPIVSSLDQRLLTETDDVIDYTVRHCCTPIHWLKTVSRLRSLGVNRIIECGPGVSISRHGKFMPYDISYVNVKNLLRQYGI